MEAEDRAADLSACVIIPIGFISALMKFGFGLEQLSYMAANLNPIQAFLAHPRAAAPRGTGGPGRADLPL